MAGKYFFYQRSSDFLHAIHKSTLDEDDIDRILQITNSVRTELERYKTAITARQLAAKPSESDSPEPNTSPFFAELAKMVLSMYAAKPYAIMYGPLRRHHLLDSLRRREPK